MGIMNECLEKDLNNLINNKLIKERWYIFKNLDFDKKWLELNPTNIEIYKDDVMRQKPL